MIRPTFDRQRDKLTRQTLADLRQTLATLERLTR